MIARLRLAALLAAATVIARLRLAGLLAAALLALVVLPPAAAAASGPPPLSVNAAALTELTTGQLLYKSRAFSRLPIASTTKLMTALITLEHVKHLSRVFTQNNFYASSADSQIGLVPGERMSVHDLLLALLLPSADDAAEDLAFNVGHGSVARFIGMMNARARQLGLTRTHYSTPERPRHAGQLLDARPICSRSRGICCSTSRGSRVWSPCRMRCSRPAATRDMSPTATTSSAGSHGSAASKRGTQAVPATSSSARASGAGWSC